jgi:hypothetical protein
MGKYLFLLLLGCLAVAACVTAQETKKFFPLSDFSGAISPGQALSVSSGHAAAKINWESYGAISFYVKSATPGTSGGALAFDIKDAGGEIFRFIVKNISETESKWCVLLWNFFRSRKDRPPMRSSTTPWIFLF